MMFTWRAALVGATLILAACSTQPTVSAAPASVVPSERSSPRPTPTPSPSPSPSPSPEVEHVVASEINAALRDELLAMMAQDQAVRTGVAPPGDDRTADELFAAWGQVDADNQARMEEILDEFGWPG